MEKTKFEKIFEIIACIIMTIGLIFMIGLIYMIISLFNYSKCSDQDFTSEYCERYRDY